MSILDNENVQELIRVLDLAMPVTTFLEVEDYKYENDTIVINKVKLLDSSGNFIRFAKLKEVTPYLCKYPVIFRERIADTEQTDQEPRE